MSYSDYPDVYLPSYLFFQNLSRNFEQLRRIFDLLPIGVMATDINGVIIYYNRAHGKIDNLKPQEVLGRPEPEVFGYPEVSPGIMRSCQKMGRPILGFMCPYFTRKEPQRTITGAYWVFPLFGADKKVVGSVCFTMHLTEDQKPETTRHLMWPDYLTASKSGKKIVGENPQLLKAVSLAKTRADSPSAVMISGETGTGKELFARTIHNSSSRAKAPFLAINCAAIPVNLLEGLLFGTTRGSFTGAVDRPGLFAEADGGTVYLDEIDSMPMELQPKLLRVLQEMKVSRLGSSVEKKLDVKIISSIGTPIQEVLVRGKMRLDLFYRLAVIVINVPALRERMDDLDELANYFIARYNKQLGKNVLDFDTEAKKWLKKYSWPGNVRELENLIAGSINMVDRETILTRAHLPEHYLYTIELQEEEGRTNFEGVPEPERLGRPLAEPGPVPGRPLTEPDRPLRPAPEPARVIDEAARQFQEEEKDALRRHLRESAGRLNLAAAALGISRQMLRYKMKKYGLSRYEFLPKLGR